MRRCTASAAITATSSTTMLGSQSGAQNIASRTADETVARSGMRASRGWRCPHDMRARGARNRGGGLLDFAGRRWHERGLHLKAADRSPMKTFLLRFFTWWHGQTFGTQWWTWL